MSVFALLLTAFFALQPALSAPILHSSQAVLSSPDRNCAEEVIASLKKSSVIPDVLSSFTPVVEISITYPNHPVTLGSTVPPASTQKPPALLLSPFASVSPTRTIASNKTYTVLLSDPDATSRAHPTKSQMCHWILTSVPLSAANASSGLHEDSAYTLELTAPVGVGEEIMPYMGPAPPKGTGKHRYVFVVLEGEGGKELSKPDERAHWGYGKKGKGVREWAEENGLSVVGANFFYAENENQ